MAQTPSDQTDQIDTRSHADTDAASGSVTGTTAAEGAGQPLAPRRTTPLSLAALAAVAVPGLDPARLAFPQEETDSLRRTGVIDTRGRHWEVVQALTDAEGAALDAEAEVLRRLARQHDAAAISFDVPRPAGSVRQAGVHVQVRSYVDGRPLDVSALRPGPGLSAGVGRALGELHELPTSVVSESGLPVYDADDVHAQWVTVLSEARETGEVPPELLHRWQEVLDNTALWRFRPSVVHGDMAEENIITAGGAILAIRGVAQMHVGDPAEDLAWIYACAPVDCLDSIDAAYDLARTEGVDKHVRERAEFVSEMSLARWLLHGVRTGDEAIIADARAMLEDLVAQVGTSSLAEPAEPVLAAVPLDEAAGAEATAPYPAGSWGGDGEPSADGEADLDPDLTRTAPLPEVSQPSGSAVTVEAGTEHAGAAGHGALPTAPVPAAGAPHADAPGDGTGHDGGATAGVGEAGTEDATGLEGPAQEVPSRSATAAERVRPEDATDPSPAVDAELPHQEGDGHVVDFSSRTRR